MKTKISNISELKTRKGTDLAICETLGYYTPSDGGAGTYQWNPTSTLTDNGGTVISVTGVATGRWELLHNSEVNIKQFGAKGDNITDDTQAIQKAINTGFTVIIPKGVFLVTSNLNLQSNQELKGLSKNSVLKANADTLKKFINITGLSNVTIKNFSINGGGQTSDIYSGIKSCFAVYITSSTDITVDTLWIDKCGVAHNGDIIDDNGWGGYGIIAEARDGAIENILINNCTITDIAGGGYYTGDGIYIAGYNSNVSIVPENIVVSNCYVKNTGRHCFTAAGGESASICENVKFINCKGVNSALSGIDLEEGNYITVQDTEFIGCGNYIGYYNPTSIPEYGATYRLRTGIATGNDSHNNNFKNIRIRNCCYGITWGAGTYNNWENIIIQNSTINDLQLGLARFGENNTLKSCKFLTVNKVVSPFYNMPIDCNLLVDKCVFASEVTIVSQQNSSFSNNIFKKKVSIGYDNKNITFSKNSFYDNIGLDFNQINTYAEDFTIEGCKFIGQGAGYFFGIRCVFQSVIRLNITGCLFKNYQGGTLNAVATDGHGIFHVNGASQNAFGIISDNKFVNVDYGIRIFQGGKYTNIENNTFSQVSSWCIYMESISAALQLLSFNFIGNISDNTCVNGLWIESPTGTWDYCIIKNNRFQDVTSVDYNFNALTNNTNGITEAPVLIKPVITKTASFTLTKADAGKIFYINSSSAVTVTIPQDAISNIRIGTVTTFIQIGTGQVSFTATGGANVHSEGSKFKTLAQRAVVYLTKTNYEESILSGERTV